MFLSFQKQISNFKSLLFCRLQKFLSDQSKILSFGKEISIYEKKFYHHVEKSDRRVDEYQRREKYLGRTSGETETT